MVGDVLLTVEELRATAVVVGGGMVVEGSRVVVVLEVVVLVSVASSRTVGPERRVGTPAIATPRRIPTTIIKATSQRCPRTWASVEARCTRS